MTGVKYAEAAMAVANFTFYEFSEFAGFCGHDDKFPLP